MRYAAILAGGKGVRFWPLSREEEPKQLLKIFDNCSLLQHTYKRISKIIDPANIYVVTNKDYANAIKYQLCELGCRSQNIIVEVSPKNTAASIGLAASIIKRKDSEGILAVFPSDHLIKQEKKFVSALRDGFTIAEEGHGALFGVRPLRAESGYGYIQIKNKHASRKGAYQVKKFIEKPNHMRAAKLFQRRDVCWNSGIFIWDVSVLLGEIRRYLPQLHGVLNETNDKRFERQWDCLKPLSIDYGIIEKCKTGLYVIALDCGWTDLGNWSTIDLALKHDKNHNAIEGDVIALDTNNTTIWSGHHLVATLGLHDMIIADTPDALFVCPKERAQEVAAMVDVLKKKKRFEYLTPRLVNRPWGRYSVLNETERFKTKMVEVLPHRRLSLQLHRKRAEHWIVVGGVAKVTIGNSAYIVKSNQSIYVPCGRKHRIENIQDEKLTFIEVQTGRYLGEDDIERFEDDYERLQALQC